MSSRAGASGSRLLPSWASARLARLGRLARLARLGRRRRLGPKAPSATAATTTTAVTTSMTAPGVLEVHLRGGTRRNVLGRSTIDTIDSLVADPPTGARVVLLTADDPDFCAGYDLVEAGRGDAEKLIAHEDNFRLLRMSCVPVVAALHGRVIGGGLELALAADVRLAAPGTRLSLPASALGLAYSAAGLRLLVEQLGESVVRAMVLGGRVLNAEEALALGAVAEIVPAPQLHTRARELAATIASWSPVAIANNRRILDILSGRVGGDTAALRQASFRPDGDLARRIREFVTGRSASAGPPVEGCHRIGALVHRLGASARPGARRQGAASPDPMARSEAGASNPLPEAVVDAIGLAE